MNSFFLGVFSPLGLGALTVIHPCPFSINIAAVTLLVGWKHSSKSKIIALVVFVIGEMLTFAALGILISSGALNIPLLANFLQKYTLQLFGPFLIIIGMMLSGILLPNQHTMRLATRLLRKTPRSGIWGGFSLGVLIALSFCPMSAAIFFGVLIPLAVSSESTILYPVLFGVGSSFPLVVITLIISSGTTFFTRLSTAKKSTEKKVRLTAGLILILLGIYLTLRHIYNVI